jgi:hypothetical protein
LIGVLAHVHEREIVGEFFELFKTPWEFAIPDRHYAVLLNTTGRLDRCDAQLLVAYGSGRMACDEQFEVFPTRVGGVAEASFGDFKLPIYGQLATFGLGPGKIQFAGQRAEYKQKGEGKSIVRIGYDLFQEVRFLLTTGQPVPYASIPTLELHIKRLRVALVESGVSFVEIPPTPHGYEFVCCLTHDIDFYGISRHKFDRTLAGFLARASGGTLIDVIRGRRSFVEALRNWLAIIELPLVFLGIIRDFWHPFEDYSRGDDGLPSTFFLVPFKGRAGEAPNGSVNAARAVKYQASEIRVNAIEVAHRGSELAVHGIDAWRDEVSAEAEKLELSSRWPITGIRMHWLYFADESPRRLDAAGFGYDSTCGYNETVGFRAGTAQAFRFPGTQTLLELPMLIMDSAMFSPGRMRLSRVEARNVWRPIISRVAEFGGALVVNWHERSLAPERLWGAAYRELLDEVVGGHHAWFATAASAVEWFRLRRAVRFANCVWTNTQVRLTICSINPTGVGVQPLQIRVTEAARHQSIAIPVTTNGEYVIDLQ